MRMNQKKYLLSVMVGLLMTLACSFLVWGDAKPSQTITGPRQITMTVDQMQSLNYQAQSRIRYTSSNSAILQVRSDQKIRALKSGKAYLYVEALSSGTYTYTRLTVPVTVQQASQKVSISSVGTMGTGENVTLSVTSKSSCTYTSSNSTIASVNAQGLVVAKEPGTVTITVKAKATTKYLAATSSIKITVVRKYTIIQVNDLTKKTLKNYRVTYGKTFTFPSYADHTDETFIGWSTRPNAALSQVNYYAGQKITAKRNMKLYGVFYKNSALKMPALPSLSSSYGKIVIVGDSRMYRTYLRLRQQGYFNKNKNVVFVAGEGEGLPWFENTAQNQVMKHLSSTGKPTAVVLALGVNRIQCQDDYYTAYQKFATKVKGKKCRLFVTSVNPYNNSQIKKVGGYQRPEEYLYTRNSVLHSLPSYKYIDTCAYLRKNGYVHDSGFHYDTGSSDGVHYSGTTYMHIFAYIMNYVNRSAY
ncbi:MAG: Ig-like domain-containing protein [Eubacteriales bacterium]|nr:Ig-like domain-containing protein [Eubacteriales bacterium]